MYRTQHMKDTILKYGEHYMYQSIYHPEKHDRIYVNGSEATVRVIIHFKKII